jgi:hypothetical protein
MKPSKPLPAPKLVSPDPCAEINGLSLLVFEYSPELRAYRDLIEQYGYISVKPDAWYPLPPLLDFYREALARPDASIQFMLMSMNVYDQVNLPDHVRTIEDGLNYLRAFMIANIRGDTSAPTWYQVATPGERHLRLIDRTPFPHDVVYGSVYGMVRRTAPPGSAPVIKRAYLNPLRPDSDGAIYDITW